MNLKKRKNSDSLQNKKGKKKPFLATSRNFASQNHKNPFNEEHHGAKKFQPNRISNKFNSNKNVKLFSTRDSLQNKKGNKKPFYGTRQNFASHNHKNPFNEEHHGAKMFKPNRISYKLIIDKNAPAKYVGFSNFDPKKLIVKPGVKWFENLPSDPSPATVPSVQLVNSLRSEAEKLQTDDIAYYHKYLEKRKEKSDFTWMKTILHSGTLQDKISAHTLFIQDSPVHNLSSVESLINMVNPKGKRECLMVMDSLKELFLSDLLLPSKKLKAFPQHPLEDLDQITSGNVSSRNKRLLLWLFEEQVKNLYFKFVKNIEIVSHDTIEKTKQKAVSVMYELLKNNPEQEQYLLEHLVDKIGDPIPKVGSQVCYLLGQLVDNHPIMVAVVVKEVERVLFRLNIAERAKYYCLCFLNQLIFHHDNDNIPNHLIAMYFGLFKACIKKGEVNTKIMSALLSGVARAYPYSKLKNNVIMDQMDAMFKLIHMVSFNISIHALMLIFQVLNSKDSVSDRFYSALYRKILDPNFSHSSRQSLLLNLLYKALKKDVANVRVKAFVKRLLQIALYQPPQLQCGILLLISELSKTHTNLLDSQPFVDYSDSDSDLEDVSDTKDATIRMKTKPSRDGVSSWVHRQNNEPHSKKDTGYDQYNRNPQYCGAQYAKLWELVLLQKNFHPSVSLFGHQISVANEIKYSGDPLADFTLIRFLDRFVYRNPKKAPENAKANIHRKVFGRKLLSRSEMQPLDILSNEYIQQRAERVPVEERFIYQYLRQRGLSRKKSKKDFDVESVDSDEFEDLLDNIHADDEGKKSLDFARELYDHKQKGKKKKNKEEENSEDDFSLGEDESDFEDDFEGDEEFNGAFEDFDDLDPEGLPTEKTVEDMDEDDFIDDKTRKKKKPKKSMESSLFASADEFDALLENNGLEGTSNAFVNTDKSDVKQLAWEKTRDQYIRGTDWKSRKNRSKKTFSKKRKFTKKRR